MEIKTAQLSNSFSAYRRSLLLEQGNFKDGLILGEDVYIGAKFYFIRLYISLCR